MRFVWMAVAALLVVGVGCNRPSEADCKKAVANIRKLTKTDRDDFGVKPEAAIRSCRGNADKKSVQCAVKAETLEELEKCEGGIAESMMGERPEGDDDGEKAGDDGEKAGDGKGGE